MLILFKDLRLIRWVFNVDSIGRMSRLSAIRDRSVAKERTKFRAGRKDKSKLIERRNQLFDATARFCVHTVFSSRRKCTTLSRFSDRPIIAHSSIGRFSRKVVIVRSSQCI